MNPNRVNAAVIISTYNWPEALAVVLRSAILQSASPAELIVADDGSKPETADAVESVLRPSGLRWCHVWQEDRGFRQARVRNLGARASSSPYLIFIDHDVVLHPDFVADHVRHARAGSFLQGKRSFLPQDVSQRILEAQAMPRPLPSPWSAGLQNRKNALHWPGLGRLLMRPRGFQTALRGCNFSVHRDDFLRVDGYDELYDGVWGREDSDFCYRLFHCGITCRNLWFMAVQYHLHHATTKRRGRDRLDEELDKVRKERRTQAVRGFSQMDAEGWILNASADFPVTLATRRPGAVSAAERTPTRVTPGDPSTVVGPRAPERSA